MINIFWKSAWRAVLAVLLLNAAAAVATAAEGISTGSMTDAQAAWQDIHGHTHTLGDYRGKWVVVNYWATWCPPCLAEIPELAAFHERHQATDAVVLGMNMEQIKLSLLQRFVERHAITYPVFPGDARMQGIAPVRGLPTTFLVAPDGRIMAKKTGGVTAADIEAYINKYPGIRATEEESKCDNC